MGESVEDVLRRRKPDMVDARRVAGGWIVFTTEKEAREWDGAMVARTIKEQLRHGDYLRPARWAARNYARVPGGPRDELGGAEARGGCSFDVSGTSNVPRGTVHVYLMGNDTYTVRVLRRRCMPNMDAVVIEHCSNVYNDQLGEVIDGVLDG